MYALDVRPSLDKKLAKLAKRNPRQLDVITRKSEEIAKNPHHYKNLRAPLQHLRRVHIGGSFVLTFSVDEERKRVVLEDFQHHDRIYER
ncbi:MAG: type II toxin-antitoxin system RelE/ParE family toxin [Nanoarchaeota archaeon]